MAEIVAECDGLGQLFVQTQHLGDSARDLRHFERVREPGSIVIARGRKEHLRFVLESAEGLGVNHAVAIAMKRGAKGLFSFRSESALAVGTLGGSRRQTFALATFQLLADGHGGDVH